jgi:hypothetical protein
MAASPKNPNTPTQGLQARDAAAASTAVPASGIDETLHTIWQENRKLILGGCVAVAVVFIGWGAFRYFADRAELGIEREFEEATGPDQWRKFSADHPGHALAGIAQLKIADDAYSGGRYAEAVGAYQDAQRQLPAGLFQSRARIGAAMAQAGAGQTAEAEAALKQLAADTSLLDEQRAEAAYNLASLAAAAGRAEDVGKYTDQVMQMQATLDPQGPWLQRALALKMKNPVTANLAPAVPTGPASMLNPAATAPAPAPADGGLKLNIPGK